MKRTSLTHPLQIAVVRAGLDFGRVGITFCPGKYDRHAMTGEWVRDLALDLDSRCKLSSGPCVAKAAGIIEPASTRR